MLSMEVLVVLNSKDTCLKGHHIFRKGKKDDRFTCPSSKTPIVAKLDRNDDVVGHIPQPLSERLAPLLDSIEGLTITGTITGSSREAPEGRWVPGGGLELPCKYVVHGKKEHRTAVAEALEEVRRVCLSVCLSLGEG